MTLVNVIKTDRPLCVVIGVVVIVVVYSSRAGIFGFSVVFQFFSFLVKSRSFFFQLDGLSRRFV